MRVDLDPAALVQLHAQLGQAQPLRVGAGGRSRPAPRRPASCSASPPFAGSSVSVTPSPSASRAGHLGAQPELDPLLAQHALERLGDLARPCPAPAGRGTRPPSPRRRAASRRCRARARYSRRRSPRDAPAPGPARAPPVLVTIVFSSTSTPGSGMLSLPVAITMFLASYSVPSTTTRPGAAIRALPLSQVDLVLLEQELDALDVGGRPPRPCAPASAPGRASRPRSARRARRSGARASSKFSLDCSSALLGMQPMLRQVPPSVARRSTQAVFRPSCAARMAQT